MCSDLGGGLESFHWAFGDLDAFVFCDPPDDETAAAVAFTIAASGLVGLKTVKPLTAAAADAAIRRSVACRPPAA